MKNLNIFSLVAEYDNAKSRGVLNVPNVSFVDEDSSVRYLLKYDYVDLGLPSGLKWATCNIGASSPEQTGLYFAWGETTGYTAEQVTAGVRAFSSSEYSSGPAASISTDLTLEQDAARANLGGNWRMPTKDEYQELLDNCNVVWTSDYNETGVAGKVFTSKINGNSVFFPAAGTCGDSGIYGLGEVGYYWSTSRHSSISSWYFNVNSYDQYITRDGSRRYYGRTLRGVFK